MLSARGGELAALAERLDRSFDNLMGSPGEPNGKERRSGRDRRKSERRVPETTTESSVLTTRKAERRTGGRRTADQKRRGKNKS